MNLARIPYKMKKIIRNIKDGSILLSIVYVVNTCFALALHPYDDDAGPSSKIKDKIEIVEKTLQIKKFVLEDYHPYFSGKGLDSLERDISNIQISLDSLVAEKDSLKNYENKIVLRRAFMPWTYISDRLTE